MLLRREWERITASQVDRGDLQVVVVGVGVRPLGDAGPAARGDQRAVVGIGQRLLRLRAVGHPIDAGDPVRGVVVRDRDGGLVVVQAGPPSTDWFVPERHRPAAGQGDGTGAICVVVGAQHRLLQQRVGGAGQPVLGVVAVRGRHVSLLDLLRSPVEIVADRDRFERQSALVVSVIHCRLRTSSGSARSAIGQVLADDCAAPGGRDQELQIRVVRPAWPGPPCPPWPVASTRR